MGPQNDTFQKTLIRTGRLVYQSAYDNIINGDPQFRTYGWMNDMRPGRALGHPPFNNYFAIRTPTTPTTSCSW